MIENLETRNICEKTLRNKYMELIQFSDGSGSKRGLRFETGVLPKIQFNKTS